MEDVIGKMPLFKKIDRAVFDRIDKFKQTPNYSGMQDFYNSFEEEQQKALKGIIVLLLLIFPAMVISFLWWQNSNLKNDLELRKQIVSKSNEILGQKQGLQEVKFTILATNPIDSESMMTSRLSTLLSAQGIDLSKIQVKDFNTTSVSDEVLKSEANFQFSNLSTDELMNILMAMIQREKFRISEITITRNAETNFLQGKFHGVHMSAISAKSGEE